MKSRIHGVLVFFLAILFGIFGYIIVSGGGFYRSHHWMMNPFWMMGSSMVFILLLFGIVGVVLFRSPPRQHNNAVQILQQRLANGDITEEQYERLKDILKER